MFEIKYFWNNKNQVRKIVLNNGSIELWKPSNLEWYKVPDIKSPLPPSRIFSIYREKGFIDISSAKAEMIVRLGVYNDDDRETYGF